MKSVRTLPDDKLAALARRAAALPDVPPALTRSALALWTQQHSLVAQQQPSLLKRILATLSFDSAAGHGLALGMRSAGTDARHLLFAAAGRDIDLRIAPTPAGFSLSGQILGPDESGDLALVRETVEADGHRAALDAPGSFQCVGLAAGRYRLSLMTSNEEIELPPLDIGQGMV